MKHPQHFHLFNLILGFLFSVLSFTSPGYQISIFSGMYSSEKWIIVNIYDEDYHLFEDTIDIKTVIIIPLPGARVICDAISMTGSATEGVSCSRCTCTSECLSGRTTRRQSRSPGQSSVILDDVLLVFPASQRNGRKRLMTT